MENTTVMAYHAAIDAGLSPKDYSYFKQDVPIGNYKAQLDFTVWSKKQDAVNCCFTVLPTLEKINLSVYRNEGGYFHCGEAEVDTMEFGTLWHLYVEPNSVGNPRLVNLIPKPGSDPD